MNDRLVTTPRILDCTIRDGSYVVDFQFTAEDTAVIAAGLEAAGIGWIEIGHGLGMHAAEAGKGAAAASDEAYLRAAAQTLRRAKWGMFFIPGIGRREYLDLAADCGMSFVRVGANAPEIERTEPFVAHARARGLHVSVNLMKSYAVPPERLVELSRMAESYGADVVSLVDSAGTMLPHDVRRYIGRMKEALSVDVGFHGHDNLALGMANVLAAIEEGATVVDTTLQGIGRGGGNPVTEILVAILHKQGVETGIDLNRLMDLSERVVQPLLKGKGHDALNITSGYAGFHSSALQMILEQADRFRVDPRELIVEVSGVNRVEVTPALVQQVAADISRRSQGRSGVHVVDLPQPPPMASPGLPESLADAAATVARQARVVATKSGRLSVFNLAPAPFGRGSSRVSPFVQEEFEFVISSAQVSDAAVAAAVAAAIDGQCDVCFADGDLQPGGWSVASAVRSELRQSRLLAYRDTDTWARAVELQLVELHDGHAPVLIVGADRLASRLAVGLAERGLQVVVAGEGVTPGAVAAMRLLCHPDVHIEGAASPEAAASRVSIVAAFEPRAIAVGTIDALPSGAVVFDGGIGAIQPAAVARAHARNLRVLRPDMRAALAAELSAAIGTRRVARELMGRSEIDGVPVVAGGVVGHPGDVVVDSITNPTRVLGVAGGDGGVDYSSGDERISRVQRAIWRAKLGGDGR
jgi:4-hydroxy-2-oxovalerate aldolase